MKRRLLLWLGLPLLAIVLLGMAAKSWLLHSDSGARWMIAYVTSQLGDDLSVGEVSGNLDTGLVLTQIAYHQDGLDVKVARAEAKGEITLMPVKITIASLHAFDVEVRTLPDTNTDPKQSDSLQDILGGLSLPVDLDMQKLQITRLKVIDSNSELLFKLNSADLSGYWSDSIVLNSLEIKSDAFDANLDGDIQLHPPFSHRLTASAVISREETGSQFAAEPARFEVLTKGTAERSTIEVVSMHPAFRISGDVSRPLDDAHFDLNLTLEEQLFAGDQQGPGVLVSDVVGQLTGLPNNYALQLQATVSAGDYPPAILSLSGDGDLTSLQVSSLNVNADFIQASASGSLGWAQTASFDLNVELQKLLPSVWVPDWPDNHFVFGQISVLSEDSRIHVSSLNAKVTGTSIQVAGEGIIDPAEDRIEAALNWKTIGWPVWQQPYLVSSDSGELQVSGKLADWKFTGDMDLQSPDYPGGNFKLEGHGNMESATVNIVNGQALGGRVAGDAKLDWSGPFDWNARLEVAKLDLAVLSRELPARLDANVEVSQDLERNAFDLRFNHLHADLGGAFKGQSLDGRGQLSYDPSGINFENFNLYSQHSRLSLQGNPAASDGVEFAVEVHEPDWVSAFVGGEISGKGRVALASRQPIIDIELEATGMAWGDLTLERLTITPMQPGSENGINLAIDMVNLVSGNTGVQSGHIELTGDKDGQSLTINLNQGDYQLQSNLSGAISSWTSLDGLSWQGLLADTRLRLRDEPLLSQTGSAAVEFSAQGFNLQQTCMTTVESGGLCVSSIWTPDGQLDLQANLSTLPLSISGLIFEHGMKFTQTLGGEFSWQQSPGKNPSGRLALNISAGEFGDELEKFDAVKTGEGFIGFELDQGNLTAGEIKVPFPGIGLIDVNYSVSGLLLDGTGKVDGDVQISLNDISVVEGLIPGLENFSGQLNSKLRLSGVTSDPQLDGHLALLGASANIPFVGTQLSEVSLEGEVSSKDRVVMNGGFKAGEGSGKLALTSSFKDWSAPTLMLKVSGQDLRMLNTPELRMDADTDMSLAWDDRGWSIDGWVLVQDAKITPVAVVVSKVTESEDVEIVEGELPYGGDQTENDSIKLNGKLKVSLGDKVRVETDLAKTKLAGVVDLAWKDNLIPVADGTIHVSGTVSVFGPRLTLKDGQIRFPKTPVDNPVLEIRADRDIFGNTQIRTAGVSITGTAKRPEINAYTIPETNSDRAWALLITGNDVDYGQSVGAFEVGTYIAPKLYLSYGISLFNDGNVVSARYDLKRGFGVKASSGQEESGVDISYTIDR